VIVGIVDLSLLDVWLETLVEVARAYASSRDGGNEQQDRNDSKYCQRLSRRQVLDDFRHITSIVHAHELEDEVCHSRKVDHNHDCLTNIRFATGNEGCEKEEADRYGNGDDSKVELEVGEVRADDDEELDSEGEEEEEVEFEESDVNLTKGVSECSHVNDNIAK